MRQTLDQVQVQIQSAPDDDHWRAGLFAPPWDEAPEIHYTLGH